jgi:hypothetical protein
MKQILRDAEGSLTIEASVVLPVFLAILLLLINLVNISITYIAVDHAVSETVKQMAGQAYLLKKVEGQAANTAVKVVTKAVMLEKIKKSYPLRDIAVRDLKITELNLYKDIAVTVEYKVKPLLPLLALEEIVLSNYATERAWID